MSNTFEDVAFSPADVLLPKDADMEKWAVVACDQFTSEPDYWEEAAQIADNNPSALNLILPEVYLGGNDVEERIAAINSNMKEYLDCNVFKCEKDALIYVERTQSDGRIRKGIVGKVDLDDYEFKPGNNALIRATEGTVLSRIPPRVKVRENAPIELPHVMLLIDDDERCVIEPLGASKEKMEKLYDFDLSQGGGHIVGYKLTDKLKDEVAKALLSLKAPELTEKKYGLKGASPMLFAVGDGNHSLATAKQCYENMKKVTPMDKWDSLPSKYALVEVVNNHDDALSFEPIHRCLFEVDAKDILNKFKAYYPDSFMIETKDLKGNAIDEIDAGKKPLVNEKSQIIKYCYGVKSGAIVVPNPEKQLAVGTLQEFLDKYIEENKCDIDYIHGDETAEVLGRKPGNMAFLLPAMGKEQLFKTVMADGVLPRKTFSMGHAQDKRYYIEARKIR
ncbi:MAG: DUF1015 domain-containing protein [Lachnospiraceae bacterium]|nr:DUF1015 domain-containing protein [Lachnospiraceae bacterium]